MSASDPFYLLLQASFQDPPASRHTAVKASTVSKNCDLTSGGHAAKPRPSEQE